VVRLAVSQAHKLHLREHINVGWRVEPLNLEGQPWVGDLLLAPFGGATHGLDPDARVARGDGALVWPGFGERLKTALREAGHNPGPRTLAREFNTRTAATQLSARTARHWLSGMATPAPYEVQILADWLGVAPDWLRCGDGGRGQWPNERRAAAEPAPLPEADRERRAFEDKGRRADRLTASLVDQAIEIQRAKGDLPATVFLASRAISEHIILRVLACAAFRRKPRCANPTAISDTQRDHSDSQ
jgi:hypothetical protein